MDTPDWIRAGSYAINGGFVKWINTNATWMGDPDEIVPLEEGVPPKSVRITGVEVIMMTLDERVLRFAHGSPEAEDLMRFVREYRL